MKKIYIILFSVIFFNTVNAQLQSIENVTVGAGGDFTNQPFVPQANYSRTQTIYYLEDLAFYGTINEIRFFHPFYVGNTSPQPSTSILKIGQTTKTTFAVGEPFVPNDQLTQIGFSYYYSGYEFVLVLDSPFYFDGTSNLIIDFEDTNPYASNDPTDGFEGVEGEENTPLRSRVSITEIDENNNTHTSTLYENSYPKTKFVGNLFSCIIPTIPNYTSTHNTATIQFSNNTNITGYYYQLVPTGTTASSNYNFSTSNTIPYDNLLAAQSYDFWYRSNCDYFGTIAYRMHRITTRPEIITVPHTIDFEDTFMRDYLAHSSAVLNSNAGNNSLNGIELQGFFNIGQAHTWNHSGNVFSDNPNYIKNISLDIDLTTPNLVNPILKFDIKQVQDSYFRIRINPFSNDYNTAGIPLDFIYHFPNESDFRTISVDLTPYIGTMFTLKMDHLSEYTTAKTYIDNIYLMESDCSFPTNFSNETQQTEVTLDWNDHSENNWEITFAEHDVTPNETIIQTAISEISIPNLEPATAYDFFIKHSCSDSETPWIKKYVTTDPFSLQIPFSSIFSQSLSTNKQIAFLSSDGSKYSYLYPSNVLALFQKRSKDNWVGGNTTTEYQAWNDNRNFITSFKFIVDGTNAQSLSLNLKYQLLYYYSPQTSWFRILVNGNQLGPSYTATGLTPSSYTSLNLDLSSFVGTSIEITIQHAGRSTNNYTLGSIGDVLLLKEFNLSGTLSTTSVDNPSLFKIYPNPAINMINISKSNTPIDTILICDVTGKYVFNQPFDIHNDSDLISIDISNLSKGLYSIIIFSKDKFEVQKFIKQ